MTYDQEFMRICRERCLKTLRSYGCETQHVPARPSWAVATNFTMRIENRAWMGGSIRHDLYELSDLINTAVLKAGAQLQGLNVYDVRLIIQDDPMTFGRKLILQVISDPMPTTVDLDEHVKVSKQEPYALQSARLIRD